MLASDLRLMQVPLQLVRGSCEESSHLPAEQTCPALQVLEQAPQLAPSVCRLTQVELQVVRPFWQDSAHLPAEQTWPALQVPAQEPQL